MGVDRLLLTSDARKLIALTRELADEVLAPIVDEHEKAATYPDEIFAILGEAGLLSLAYPEEFGGGGQPYEVYLQVLEELAARWAAVAVAVSSHTLACYPLTTFGTATQQKRWLPTMLSGDVIGACSWSEPRGGSTAATASVATPVDGGYLISGSKARITHGGIADFYSLYARTADEDVSCFFVDADSKGLTFGAPETKTGLRAVPTTSAHYDDVFAPAERLVGSEGQGLEIAHGALDSGRLGIAAVAVGIAQAALDEAIAYVKEGGPFGYRIVDSRGLLHLVADMGAAVDSARASYIDAARRRDAGLPYSGHASVAKLVANEAAMRVTTDAVQICGGYLDTEELRVKRYMRDAIVTQTLEGTSSSQRLVIARSLDVQLARLCDQVG